MWNDTDVPLAYLITFRTYGTWLHGDERGSINRFRNQYKSAFLPPQKSWLERNTAKLKSEPVKLDAKQRSYVEKAIRECCSFRDFVLMAINVRTNHVHSVVGGCDKGSGSILGAFKANATRELRKHGIWKLDHSPWVDKGSRRNLWNEDQLARAIDYVVNGQGDDLPKFLDD
jgi:REP element-mobilizing transposase RayT